MSKHICSCVFIIYIQSPLQNRSITLSNTKGANLAHFTYLDEPLSGKVNAFWDTETVSGRFNHEILVAENFNRRMRRTSGRAEMRTHRWYW